MKGKAEVLIFEGPTVPLKVLDVELPSEIGDGELLCKVLLAAICGSDVHTIDGRRKEPTPSVLGHEGVAEVLVSRRDGFSPGDRISFTVADSCGVCSTCSNGLKQKCQDLFKYGHAVLSDGSGLNGCYASHILLRQGTFAVKIPANLPNEIVVPANCALSTMVNALESVNTLGYYKPSKYFIQGAGLLGLYACALLSHSGIDPSDIYCSDVSPERLSLVKKFGGTPVKVNEVSEVVKNNRMDVVVEACGNKAVIKEGIQALRPGGVYILVGLIHADSHLDLTAETIMRKCLTLRGIHNYGPKHLIAAVKFLENTILEFPYSALVDPKKYSFNEISSALVAVKQQKFARVCLMP